MGMCAAVANAAHSVGREAFVGKKICKATTEVLVKFVEATTGIEAINPPRWRVGARKHHATACRALFERRHSITVVFGFRRFCAILLITRRTKSPSSNNRGAEREESQKRRQRENDFHGDLMIFVL